MSKITNTTVRAITKEEIEAIKLFYDAWKKKQPELLDEVCTPNWQDIPLAPGQKEGPIGLQEIMKKLIETFPDIEIIIHEIFGTHERAGVRAELIFTHDKELLGIPPVNKKVTIALHEFHYLKDGKLTHTWHLEDWFGLLIKSDVWSANRL
ncbi:putative ester cyclase [Aquimarina sp. MAR_2010_214]|uniref:ester cyclase n=1 Tax=Aquimarina sp. MAR_2010_214 TaxID=1250026 RepID=UPI000C70FAA6|nr:ester cyclase [Aquimarina sp. MAR_2010_214]PKV50648.1 putative ester cyclase [Aquimarina sp. MAR_2010_214]